MVILPPRLAEFRRPGAVFDEIAFRLTSMVIRVENPAVPHRGGVRRLLLEMHIGDAGTRPVEPPVQ